MLQAVVSFLLVAALHTGSAIPVARCHPADYICEGRCPLLPSGVSLPSETDQGGGLCLKELETNACVCWLQNSDQHLQTLFKCEVAMNSTVKHIMCLPPPICFPPHVEPGCMIVRHCPCTDHGRGTLFGKWRSSVAFILQSKTPVPVLAPAKEGIPENPQNDAREFSLKHLLFLLAFVIAPLLCWCLLTFFHEGKCLKKHNLPETEPMPTERMEEIEEPLPGPCTPTAPKLENPPSYMEAADPVESCLLAADCGPPPSYEDAVRDQQWPIQEMDSE